MPTTRELLNNLYQPLEGKLYELIAKLTKLHSGFKVTSGFYNGHYHKNIDGLYKEDKYPIPVISVTGLCDIEIDIDDITVTTKFSREQITVFDWNKLGDIHFEVYGVKDYLSDYGNELEAGQIRNNIQSSTEKEFFISFSFPMTTNGDTIMKFMRTLQKNHFYY